MENQNLQEFIQKACPGCEVKMGKQYVEATVDSKDLHALAKLLKDSNETQFDYLFCESGVDFGTYLMVIYHLESTVHRHQVVLRAKITDRENPVIDSVWDLWKGADLNEREIFDLLGIKFTNHPDLRKIFLDADWVGYPLRKDYKDDVNMVER